VAAIGQNKRIVEVFGEYLKKHGMDNYIRKVSVKDPDRLHLVLVEKAETLFEQVKGKAIHGPAKAFQIHQTCPGDAGGCGYVLEIRGNGMVDRDGSLLIPYTMLPGEGTKVFFECRLDDSFAEKHGLPAVGLVRIEELKVDKGVYQFAPAGSDIRRFKHFACVGVEPGH